VVEVVVVVSCMAVHDYLMYTLLDSQLDNSQLVVKEAVGVEEEILVEWN